MRRLQLPGESGSESVETPTLAAGALPMDLLGLAKTISTSSTRRSRMGQKVVTIAQRSP